MKIPSKYKTHFGRNLSILLVAILLVISLPFIYVYGLNGNLFGWQKQYRSDSIDLNAPTKSQVDTGDAIKSSIVNSNNDKSNQTDNPPAPTTQAGSSKKSVQVNFTTPQLVQNNGLYHIGTQISVVTDTGICTLVLTKDGSTVTPSSVGIQAQAKVSTCKGFDVALTQGTWQATFTFENDTYTGTTTSQLTTVN